MINKKLLQEWSACWTEARINSYLGSRTEVSPREVYNDTSISLLDRVWVLTKCVWYLDESAARSLAIEFARSVAHLTDDEDWFLGLLNEMDGIEDLPSDQQSAANAARSAAYSAARSAAESAARSAARNAAYNAAWAAESAAESAARSAAYNAAWAAWAAYNAAYSAANAAESAAYNAARSAAYSAAESAARSETLQKHLDTTFAWLGDYADGWEES